ncbi:MAG: hypothetical protein JNL43_12725 [Flavobacteriales bacterium]|nr:hypothetical protein [Flavobacteriales bacterium]
MATQQATDNSGEAPVEVTYLTIDPASVSDAIDLDASTPRSLGEMDSKQRRWFWGFISAFAAACLAAILTQNAFLALLAVMGFFLLLKLGFSIIRQSRSVGVVMIGSVLAVSGLALFGQHLHKKFVVSKCAHSSSYRDGYAFGEISSMMDASGSCNDMIEGMESELGSAVGDRDCYCAGWDDAKSGRPSAYKE